MCDTTCQPCPGNTVMDQEAAAQCECLDGYFRNNENRTDPRAEHLVSPIHEKPNASCTRELQFKVKSEEALKFGGRPFCVLSMEILSYCMKNVS